MSLMNESVCTYGETRDELLVSYVYNELAVDERSAFDRHLAACALCRGELDALREVRFDLKQWAPPEPLFRVPLTQSRSATRSRIGSLWPDIPTWVQAAAAVLFLGAGAGMANLEITYGASGLSVQTGWRHRAADPFVQPALLGSVLPSAAAASAWRADLTALEQRLRNDLAVRPVAAASTSAPSQLDEASLRRVRALVQESEQRQQRELALRVAEMARQVEGQRQADLVRIDRNLGLFQSRTGMEVMRTQQQVNSLAQAVSQRREP